MVTWPWTKKNLGLIHKQNLSLLHTYESLASILRKSYDEIVFPYFIITGIRELAWRSSVASISSPVAYEERMRSGHWLWSVLCVAFSALTLMVGWQEGHLACKNSLCHLFPNVIFQNKRKNTHGNYLKTTTTSGIPCHWTFNHRPHYLFSVNSSRHFFSVNPSPIFYYDIFVLTVHAFVDSVIVSLLEPR